MEFDDEGAVERVHAMPAVRECAHDGQVLMDLWPLSEALQLDNDARYAENLQVRVTRMAAIVMTGTPIAMADAEFVYEGADSIPGRDQSTVDALLAANDAYELAVPEDGDATLPQADTVTQVADLLDAGWDDGTCADVAALIAAAGTFAADTADAHRGDLAWRLALCLVLLSDAMRRVRAQLAARDGAAEPHAGGAPEDRVATLERMDLPLLFLVQAVGEALGVPPICLRASQWHGVVAASATPNGDGDTADAAAVLAESLAPLAAAEWRRHREEILWDPAEAKKRAREEDERKNKEALAAKFAHVKDDPGKEEVEL